jgi:polysaccharide transporter, PST family
VSGWRPLLKRVGRSAIFHNALALYAIQGASFLLPLVTLPYLARVLGPEGWGVVMFAQAFSIWLALLLNYGFGFSGTRAVARHRDEPGRLAAIVTGVQGAKVLLLVLSTLLALLAWRFVPIFRSSPEYLFWAWGAAMLQGFSPVWFFQGIERLRAPAALDVFAKLLATVGIFVVVRAPEHGWMVLALRAGAEMISTGVLTAWLYRAVPRLRFSLSLAREMLRDGWSLFVFVGAASVYTSANAFLLGLLAPAREVSFFGAGERIVRAASLLLGPLSQALYPRVSNLVAHDRERASVLIRRSLLPFVGLGVAMGVALIVLAPLITRVVFGPEYAPVASVIRVLAIVPMLLGVGTVLGLQWALPMGMDRIYTRFVLFAGVLNVVLAVTLVPHYGAVGMAVASVLAEASVEVGLVWLVLRHGGDTWRRQPGRSAGATAASTTDPAHPPGS